MGRFQSGQMEQTVNLSSLDFEGSNPSLPTNFQRSPGGSDRIKFSLKRLKAEVAHLVEHQPSKLRVAGSSPVFRSEWNLRTRIHKPM